MPLAKQPAKYYPEREALLRLQQQRAQNRQPPPCQEKNALLQLQQQRARKMQPPLRKLNLPVRKLINRILPKDARTGTPVKALLYKWTEIVGPELASLCKPVKIVRNAAAFNTLHIQTDSAAAAMLAHLQPLLLERVQASGVKNLKKIRFHHNGMTTSQNLASPAHTMTQKNSPPYNKLVYNKLAEPLKTVKNTKLRSALEKLANAVSMS